MRAESSFISIIRKVQGCCAASRLSNQLSHYRLAVDGDEYSDSIAQIDGNTQGLCSKGRNVITVDKDSLLLGD